RRGTNKPTGATLTQLGKHGVSTGALGYFLPARQFLPGRLLINGMQILVLTLVPSVMREGVNEPRGAQGNRGRSPCVMMIFAAATTSKTGATTVVGSAVAAASDCRWAAAVSASARLSCSASFPTPSASIRAS